jgi:predicted nucleic acid-binding protein
LTDSHPQCHYLADTNVIIDYLRGRPSAVQLLGQLMSSNIVACSTLTVTEIYIGMRPEEKPATDVLIDALVCLQPTIEIAKLAGTFIQRYRKQGITLGLADAVIAATAVTHELRLVTYNVKHYPMPEVRLYPAQ